MINESLKEFLKEKGVLLDNVLQEAYETAEKNNSLLYRELVRMKAIEEKELYKLIAEYFHIEYKFAQLSELNFELIKKFPLDKLDELKTLPIYEDGNTIVFILSNPFRIEDAKELKKFTDANMEFALIEPSQMEVLLRHADNKILQANALSDFISNDSTGDVTATADGQYIVDAPIIKYCDSILRDAVNRSASDIHIEPFEDNVIIRFRIDGKLQIIDEIQQTYYQSILARFKIMAEMNIAERRVPQDGKITLVISNKKLDFRVSTIPTIFGEKMVIRIYDVSLTTSSLANLGMSDVQERLVMDMIHKPHGIVLLTGPTGSGKSTSLYTFLRYLNNSDTNIITVEDPVENQIDGINQVQVNPKANMTFASALRSILRQDPNIIMIGEIRDEETVQIATRAAITGHLVFSTIHANNSYGVVTRLINMGIPPYLVADSLLGVISQRLVRKLCPECKKPRQTTRSEMAMLGLSKPQTIYEACGCQACNNTGYNGRIGVFELLVCNPKIRETIMSPNFTSELLENVAKVPTIMDHAKERVLNGITSMDEYKEISNYIDTTELEEGKKNGSSSD